MKLVRFLLLVPAAAGFMFDQLDTGDDSGSGHALRSEGSKEKGGSSNGKDWKRKTLEVLLNRVIYIVQSALL
jgi:hypothetical protein